MTCKETEEGNKALKAGSNLAANYEVKYQKGGDLYLKYKLIDDSFGLSGFRLTDLDTKLKDIIGKPFPRQVANPLETRMKDGHDWSMVPNAGYEDHLVHAWNNAEGVVVDLSSELDRADPVKGGSKTKNIASKYVTIKILDPVRKQFYIDNPKNVPKAVSIGVFDDDYGANGNVISNYRPVHVMPVDNPAWKDATHIGSCNGEEQQCTAALRGASNYQEYVLTHPATKITSEEFTSLDSSNENKNNNMSSQQGTDSSVNTGQTQVVNPTTQTPGNTTGSVLRLKTATANTNTGIGAPIVAPQPQQTQGQEQIQQVQDPNANTANPNQNQQKTINDDPDLQTMKLKLDALEKEASLEKRKNMIRSKIPREAFVIKDKFNNDAFEKEVEKMAKKENWTDVDYDTYYAAQRRLLELSAAKMGGYAGYYTPEGNNPFAGNPLLGGSDTDNSDDALKAGSVSSQKIEALKECIRMIGVEI